MQIYVAEAHACDEWPIGSSIEISQHRSVQDRRDALQKQNICLGPSPWPVYVDSLPEHANFAKIYGAWPFRFYIFRRNKLLYLPDPVDCGYSLIELRETLEQLLAERNN